MKKFKLDDDEQAVLDAFEADQFESNLTPERRVFIAKSAEATFKKDKKINIRISSRDLSAIQRRALEEGIPYQTLVSSIIHKYISGSLRDALSNKSTNNA
jgi:predicted DNA binding CopG/RHH family protein